jgi:uncharacterized protein (TIGR02421 family)
MTGDDGYRAAVRELSDRLVDAQGTIRVLNAIKWDDRVREAFFAAGCTEQPPVDPAYYEGLPLGFDPDEMKARLRDLAADASARLGPLSPAGTMIRFMVEQFRVVIEMLEARGTPAFSAHSVLLYGSPDDVFHVGGPTAAALGAQIRAALEAFATPTMGLADPRDIPCPEAVAILQGQLDRSMGPGTVQVRADDGIVADAAAGATSIKLNASRSFSQRDLDLLEAHEGWVHIGTTLNGLAQPVCTFLGKAAPRTTVTQEGLAVLTEVLNLRSHPRRLARLMHRIEGIAMAASGATFVEVFEAFRTDGMSEDDAWASAARIFRGSLPTLGPFTKDLGYGKGFVLAWVYVRLALQLGKLDRIPMLFCGKVDLLDLAVLHHLEDEGLVAPPAFVPPPFDDLPAMASTLSLTGFASSLDLARLESDLSALL